MSDVDLYLYGTEVPVGKLCQFLSDVELKFNYLILEFHDCVLFEKFTINPVRNEDNINRGRVFNNSQEMRWRRKGDKFTVALISEDALVSEKILISDSLISINWESEKMSCRKNGSDKGVLLWGNYLDSNPNHRWFERHIPKPQFYPVDKPSSYVRFKTINYYNDEGLLIGRRLAKPYPSDS